MNNKTKQLNTLLENLFHQLLQFKSDYMNGLSNNLNTQEFRIIFFLGNHNQPIIMKNISEHLNLKISNTSIIIDKLVKKKYIYRKRPADNRRVVHIILTEKGKIIYNSMLKNHLNLSEKIFSSFKIKEQDNFLLLLEKAIQSLK